MEQLSNQYQEYLNMCYHYNSVPQFTFAQWVSEYTESALDRIVTKTINKE